ncbi:pyridoxine kinase [Friedmanniella endophytica]|uniref:pyridoxal kinase n=1 Tax=Microlunatus kandeliicorticis TaxID=1759536 RepID=A0A7W3ITK5_9ACTN|nr:pyridoxal kinase PdxY [Microlunatus kandeliicorticis]MBA8794991.1 pyridoxine kinase [Microlunatus kandeliicorticis]
MTSILSIQSSVAYGHVGNSAATFPLMRRGVEVWPVITVHFSNHTGYGAWRGPMLGADDVLDVVTGIDERGVLGRCDAVLSGYQGAPEVSAAILAAVDLVKRRNPAAIYCCDPVIGDDDRGVYVRPELAPLIKDRVLPAAQVVTPNQFELEYLTDHPVTTLADVLAAAAELRRRGPRTVLVTSVRHEQTPADQVEMVAVDDTGAWAVRTPLLPRTFNGTGDLTAAMFLAALLDGVGLAEALARTAAIVYGVLDATWAADARELQLVAAQDQLVAPTRTFEVTALG